MNEKFDNELEKMAQDSAYKKEQKELANADFD